MCTSCLFYTNHARALGSWLIVHTGFKVQPWLSQSSFACSPKRWPIASVSYPAYCWLSRTNQTIRLHGSVQVGAPLDEPQLSRIAVSFFCNLCIIQWFPYVCMWLPPLLSERRFASSQSSSAHDMLIRVLVTG